MTNPPLERQVSDLRHAQASLPTTDDYAELATDIRDLATRLKTLEQRLVKAVAAFYDASP